MNRALVRKLRFVKYGVRALLVITFVVLLIALILGLTGK